MYYYTYIILFVTGYYYYGMRSCKCLPEEDIYWGTPTTHKEYWKTTMYSKTILNTYSFFEECSEAEVNLIKPVYRTDPFCLNMNCGGAINHTEEVRASMSAAQKGVPKSPETRASMSAAKSNQSDETRAKNSAAHKGKKHSPETRAKIGAARKESMTPEVRAKMSAAAKNRKKL